jgi:tRNA threonylcarbamoyladenosine biosynthesis protein TsaE
VAWAGLIFGLSSIPHLAITEGPSDFWLRKTAHVTVYAILYGLVFRAIGWDRTYAWSWRRAILALVIGVAYATSDELHQHYVTGRHGAATDVLIDTGGMLLGLAGLAWWLWWQRAITAMRATEPAIHVVTLAQLPSLAEQLVANWRGGEVIALSGDLGAGKTTLTQLLAKAIGVTDTVASPTFGLHKQYGGANGLELHHFDWYRLDSPEQVEQLGVADVWDQPQTITVIEWPERAAGLLPERTIRIHIDHVDAETRRIIIHP